MLFRLVFTLSDCDVVCPAYDHFRQCLKDLELCTDDGLQYEVEQVEINFPQCFRYKRTPQLVCNDYQSKIKTFIFILHLSLFDL